ncbi:hypothetical protein NLJ89_g10914 [Agrocybe chaxingu]|uniref:Uncharacterized protein n=1 Tax=Agrocybe chaxingu TaxID=84603 RepID=A0A9W8MRN6_9AGAR|nr:hypothetical protein NLJ89_g10914 [Agrocybe chaxingu]
MKCNTDVKFVGSREAAKSFLYYVTDYVTKPSLPVHVGMAALSYAVKKTYDRMPDIKANGDLKESLGAVTIAVNSMMGWHEVSHPQVMSYLVGGGDHYTSEHFHVLQWGSIARYVDGIWASAETEVSPCISPEGYQVKERVGVDIRRGEVSVGNQKADYLFRSDESEFEALCLYEFASVVCKSKFSCHGRGEIKMKGSFSSSEHPQRDTHYLKFRKTKHVPVLLGPSIPNLDKSVEGKELWAKYMLVLFRPWRSPLNLKERGQTWLQSYEHYETQLSLEHRQVIANMNVLTECKEARDVHISRRQTRANDSFAYLANLQAKDDDASSVIADPIDKESFVDREADVHDLGRKEDADMRTWKEKVDVKLAQLVGHETVAGLNRCLSNTDGGDCLPNGRVVHMNESDAEEVAEHMKVLGKITERNDPPRLSGLGPQAR